MQACRLKIRRNFLTQTVLNDWNKLPSYVVEVPFVNSFKNRLADFLADMDNWKPDAYEVHQQQVT